MGLITSRHARRVLSALLFAAALVTWVAFLRPAALGGSTTYVIVSGESMEPLLHSGDLAIVRPQESYGVGDVTAYRIPDGDVGEGMLVVHRVTGGDETTGLVLQGDNRDYQDVWRPTAEDVAGTVLWHVPHVGTALFLLRSPIVLAALLGFGAFWIVGLREPTQAAVEAGPISVDEHPLIVRRRAQVGAAGRPLRGTFAAA